jgi:phosphotriesterase-related protein
MITGLKDAGLLEHLLISHDNGWSVEGEHLHGATLKSWTDPHSPPYLALFKRLLPDLRNNGFSTADIDQLLIRNPASAFTLRTRLLSSRNI